MEDDGRDVSGDVGRSRATEVTHLERESMRERWRERSDGRELCASMAAVFGDLLGHLASL